MYFPTYNFYDDIVFTKEEQCLICWDSSDKYDEITKMQQLTSFIPTCTCNGCFHNKCLFTWVHSTHSCPICHKDMQINIILNSNNNNNVNFIATIVSYKFAKNVYNGTVFITRLASYIIITKIILFMIYVFILNFSLYILFK